MKKHPEILLLIFLIVAFACKGGLVPSPSIPPTQVAGDGTLETHCVAWNLAEEISTSPHQENPNRDSCGNVKVWYFMQSTSLERDPTTYQMLTNYQTSALGIPGLELWEGSHVDGAPYPNQPSIGTNVTGVAQHPIGILWLPKQICGHPAPNQLLVVGWKSPYDGTVKVVGSVRDLDTGFGDGIAWFVDHDLTSIASGEYEDGGSQDFRDSIGGSAIDNISVKPGEFIYFVLHPKSNHAADSTLLDILITSVE